MSYMNRCALMRQRGWYSFCLCISLDEKLMTKSAFWPQMTFSAVDEKILIHDRRPQPHLLWSSRSQTDPMSIMEMGNILKLSHWVIRGRLRKWDGLRSHTSKIWDIFPCCRHRLCGLITICDFQVTPSIILASAEWQNCQKLAQI